MKKFDQGLGFFCPLAKKRDFYTVLKIWGQFSSNHNNFEKKSEVTLLKFIKIIKIKEEEKVSITKPKNWENVHTQKKVQSLNKK